MLSLSVCLSHFILTFSRVAFSGLSVRSVRRDVEKNVSTQTVLRPSDDNDDDNSNNDDDSNDDDESNDDDDDSNDDRVGAVVEQFGRTEEQIY